MSDEDARAIELLRRVNRFIRAGDLDDATLGELTMAQVRVLFRLRNHGPMASGSLANKLAVTLPTVTSVVDRLVGHGLVERRDDPDDRRRVIVALSADGAALVERIQQGRRARLAAAIEALEPEQRHALIEGLSFLVDATERVERAEVAEPVRG
jgi:DNA-binding MarR family transcriptional regulator